MKETSYRSASFPRLRSPRLSNWNSSDIPPSQTLKLVKSPDGTIVSETEESKVGLKRHPSDAPTMTTIGSSSSIKGLLPRASKEDRENLESNDHGPQQSLSSVESHLNFLPKEPRLSGFLTGLLLVCVTVASHFERMVFPRELTYLIRALLRLRIGLLNLWTTSLRLYVKNGLD
jgi:hypothetical protein